MLFIDFVERLEIPESLGSDTTGNPILEMAVSNWWTGLLEWITGMDLTFFSLLLPPAIYIEELV